MSQKLDTKKRTLIWMIVGVFLILLGLVALFTPFTPGSWLVFVGLEILGIRLSFWQKIKAKFF